MESAAYEQFAELEETHYWFRGRRSIFFHLLDQLLEEPIDRNEKLRILEVGCGSGGFLRRLHRYGHPTGLELSLDMAHLAEKRSGEPTVCGNVYDLPMPDSSYDLVCLFDAIEHVPDEARALAEIHRVLEPGGLGFFTVPAYQFLYANNDRVASHQRRYTRRRLLRALSGAGFETVRATYYNTLLLPAIVPAVLLGKLEERWLKWRDPDHTNLTVPIPARLAELLYRIMASECSLLDRTDLPFGHSLIAVVRKGAG